MKNWNRQEIEHEIHKIKWATTDPRMDGFTTWVWKQDLIRLKYCIDEALADCPTYYGEEDFINKMEQEKTFNLLKKKHQ